MARGGARPGAGRKKKVAATEEWKGPELPEGKQLRPLDFWLALLRDGNAPLEIRMTAAKEAMPFMHAKPAPSRDGDQTDLANAPGAGDDWTHDLNPNTDQKGLH
ncbi:hypothetical protein [Acetobacter sp.]|uniref:hypothetical protein n=1 Tax=Acetobacter sp. TaxID=440 RepID=UPI00258BC0E3|nr:hypothetical protein [Acetobacter sp.]MCC6104772.1 hypothetical protein [Acetobacter sp.]